MVQSLQRGSGVHRSFDPCSTQRDLGAGGFARPTVYGKEGDGPNGSLPAVAGFMSRLSYTNCFRGLVGFRLRRF